jgi:hypothetical protein
MQQQQQEQQRQQQHCGMVQQVATNGIVCLSAPACGNLLQCCRLNTEPLHRRINTLPSTQVHHQLLRLLCTLAGVYVPGGTAVLPSSALMLAVPAQIAGCSTVVLATPPRPDGSITPEVLYCAKKAGVTHILKAGGAQAVAAMAWGTQTCPKVSSVQQQQQQCACSSECVAVACTSTSSSSSSVRAASA